MAERLPHPEDNRVPPEKGGSTFLAKIGRTPVTETPVKPEAPPVVAKETTKKGTGKGKIIAFSFVGGAFTISAVGATVWGVKSASGSDSDNSTIPPASSKDIGSVPGGTSFSNDGSVPELEGLPPHLGQPNFTNQVNPADVSDNNANSNKLQSLSENEIKNVNSKEVFDPYAERQVITSKNTVVMSREEYKDIIPPVMNPVKPEVLNIFFPVKVRNRQEQRELVVLKREDPQSITGGFRLKNITVDPITKMPIDNNVKIPVRSRLAIRGIEEGDRIIAPVDGQVSRTGSTFEVKGHILQIESFRFEYTDQQGNHFATGFGVLFLKLTKDIPKDTIITKEVKIGQITTTSYTTQINPIPIKAGEEIGIITLTFNEPDIWETLEMHAMSDVTGEDGKKQGGPAEIVIITTATTKIIMPEN